MQREMRTNDLQRMDGWWRDDKVIAEFGQVGNKATLNQGDVREKMIAEMGRCKAFNGKK